MTGSDRAKLAKIAAFGYFQGQSESQVEGRLLSYVSLLTEDDLQRALAEGSYGQRLAASVMGEGNPSEVLAQSQIAGQSVQRYDLSVRYQMGPNPDTDWRQVTLSVPVGSTRAGLQSLIRSAINSQLSGGQVATGGRYGQAARLVAGSEQVVYAVPVFREG